VLTSPGIERTLPRGFDVVRLPLERRGASSDSDDESSKLSLLLLLVLLYLDIDADHPRRRNNFSLEFHDVFVNYIIGRLLPADTVDTANATNPHSSRTLKLCMVASEVF
jgi:hypothetical protein